MKQTIRKLAVLLAVVFGLSGCGGDQPAAREEPFLTEIEYTNLADTETRELLREVMTDAGISGERQAVLFSHVDQFNAVAGEENLTKGFARAETAALPQYDPYQLQDLWTAEYPDFLGYNCRITAYSLMADFLQIAPDAGARDEMLMMDLLALKADDSAMDGDTADGFRALFSVVPAEGTQDIRTHVETVQQDWRERGIAFRDDEKVRMISVFFHEQVGDAAYELMIGHVGILFQKSENELYFVEKVAFQEPYQMVRFQSRRELNDYLMGKYDISWGQPVARPFILENDQLLEGYRANPNNGQEQTGAI